MGGVLESAGGFLGLGGGPSVSPKIGNDALAQLYKENRIGTQDPAMHDALRQYISGKEDLSQLLGHGSDYGTMWNTIVAQDPFAGSRAATEEVSQSPILGQLFGKGGALERASAEEQQLAKQGFKLQPEDVEAYGQASGDIARLFGGQEKDVAQQLAARGLSAAPSGAAGQQYSGLLGNKYEQLAKAQTDIANKRMQNTLQRLNSTRQYQLGLGQQGASAIQDQAARQMAGAGARQANLQSMAGLQNQLTMGGNQAELAAAEFKQKNKPKNFMDYATLGLGQGIQSAGQTGFGMSPSGMGMPTQGKLPT